MTQQIGKLFLWFVAGIFAVWMIPVAIAHPPIQLQQSSSPIHLASSSEHESISTSDLSPQAIFQQGVEHYQAEQFSAAIEQWTIAAQRFAQQSLTAEQALALGYRGLGYQQLGELERAHTDLTESLTLLNSLSEDQHPASYAEIYAKVLNIEGALYWRLGHLESALASWQKAETFYAEAAHQRGMAIARINQAKVLQALGLSRQAESLLRNVYDDLTAQPDRELQVVGLQQLGAVLRQIGDLQLADTLLKEALLLASDSRNVSSILLELGNTNWEQGDRFQAIGHGTDAQVNFQAAQRYYQQALEARPSLEARLNLVGLLIQTGQLNEAVQYLSSVSDLIAQHPVGRQRIQATISFTDRWLQVAKQSDSSHIVNLSYLDIAQLLSEAVREAQMLMDQRAESYALGQLGKVYEHLGQTTNARRVTQSAQLKLEGLDTPEIQYQWEWQLGRVAKAEGDRQRALAHYETAVLLLQSVRSNLLSINSDIQFSFRDDVEPVYREFVDLLLTTDTNHSPSQHQLEKALLTVDQLQLAELENYLRCEVASIGQVSMVEDETAVRIYPIMLRDRLSLITQFPKQSDLTYYETSVDENKVSDVLQAFRTDLSIPGRTPEVIESAAQLYDWLIRPIEHDLQQSDAQMLVFVPDGALRNVPMAALFDGEQYLIQKGYATAIAPQLELFLPNDISTKLRVKLGGVGIPQEIGNTAFPTIAKLEEELDRIATIVETTPPLLNESFTVENIQQQLLQSPVSAIHWKTHGIFSSDPAQSYIVGFQQRINAATLNELIATGSQGGLQPLELLVLSACETAQGDNRAVLGLAGLAARTGTRSVVSALWIAQDTPNTEFMVRFYELLTQEEMTKAEAVRQAQLALMNEYGYTTPYIWANYILIGNWL